MTRPPPPEPTWKILVNPAAGPRAVDSAQVGRIVAGAGLSCEIGTPATTAEMRAAASDAVRHGWRRLAVVGGDGTVNVVVNAIMEFPVEQRPTLGVLPAGTGCDLLRTFGISQRLEEAVEHLRGEQTYRIDLGVLEGAWGRRFFANVAQAGVGAAAAEAAQGMSRRWGRARYPLAFLIRLPSFRRTGIRVDLNSKTHDGRAMAVIFANGQFFAGGWNVAPRSTPIDGRLDLQIIDCAKWEAARLVPKIIRGVHLTDRAVRRYATSGFDLDTEQEWPVEADGEVVGNTPVTVSVEPGALSLKI